MKHSAHQDILKPHEKAAYAQELYAATARFYEYHAQDFSRTRQNSWPGWERLLELLKLEERSSLHLIDLAAGNLRFEQFLCDKLLSHKANATVLGNNAAVLAKDHETDKSKVRAGILDFNLSVDAYDQCLSLAQDYPWLNNSNIELKLHHCNLAQELIEQSLFARIKESQSADAELICCFAYIHHLYSYETRLDFIKTCLDLLPKGAELCISLWCFGRDSKLLHKAQECTAQAPLKLRAHLEEGDFLLDWAGNKQELRYCHHFSEDELAALAQAIQEHSPLERFIRFDSDGKNSALNTYFYLKKA